MILMYTGYKFFVEKIKIRGDKNGHETRFSRK